MARTVRLITTDGDVVHYRKLNGEWRPVEMVPRLSPEVLRSASFLCLPDPTLTSREATA